MKILFQRKKDANEVIRNEVRRLQGLKAMTINVYARKKTPRRGVAVCNIYPLAEGPIPLGSEAAHMRRMPKCARDKEEGSNPIPALSAKEQRRGRTSSRSPCLG